MFLFWLPLVAFDQDVVWPHGGNGGYLVLGNAIYTYVVVTVCAKAALETSTWTWLSLLAIGGSVLVWFFFLAVYRCHLVLPCTFEHQIGLTSSGWK